MSPRERDILSLIERGYTRKGIAHELRLGNSTVRTYIRGMCERYNCTMRELPEAVHRGREEEKGR